MTHPAPSVLRDRDLWRTAAHVNGNWIEQGADGVSVLRTPSTGDGLAVLPRLDAEQVRDAIKAAHVAQNSWRKLSAKARASLLRRWFDLITLHADDLARIIVLEEGKPFAEAKGEVAYAASFVEWFSEEAKRIRGDVMAAPEPGNRIVVLKEPIGVCAAITRKAAPALAAGCTMAVKPASQTPLTALTLAELSVRAGIPPGVFSVVLGRANVVAANSPVIRWCAS